VVPFEDNRHLNRLLGEYDGHLALLEERLGIEAQAHGNVVTLTGATGAVETARDVLEKLYARIRQGEDIGPGDVDGVLRHATDDAARGDGLAQIRTRRRVVTARTPNQSVYIQALERVDLVFGLGPAGTGKTYLAVAFAAQCLERGMVDRIVLSRPAVEAGERLGFLPGDLREKVDPYLRPLYDSLYDLLEFEKVERLFERNQIEVAPIAFMRGRTLSDAFVIIDEAQNTTTEQMKMVLTRIGLGSKVVVTGDITQIDLPPGRVSGLVEAISVLSGTEGIAFCYFDDKDVVRHKLVQSIVKAYERWTNGQGKGR
jgi:phosphate starvation-inducible PhoH-like protein